MHEVYLGFFGLDADGHAEAREPERIAPCERVIAFKIHQMKILDGAGTCFLNDVLRVHLFPERVAHFSDDYRHQLLSADIEVLG